ncbi:DUF1217 domain-containing protein [Asaia siamensis]|uniref:Flagellar hook protein FlgE D2 domain-containing protein n=1 Tax=Asaia siamensis TaxID=110479 RepID=A0ABQ1L3Y8_9PROT|nr:DUF1217 domain-containing protein [Asaia siamensis]GBR09787.1 hypothetical protein AA0323_2594 [Asaia siamensis NRIC 0323]GGC19000.1 hypothetical protein GCM10007207_00320 [Asaia siamensis]
MAITNVSPVASYLSAIKDESLAASNYAKTDIVTKQAVAAFEKKASGITSADALLKDYSSLQIVLGAFGMSQYSNATALIKDLLTQDPTSSTSLARTSQNATWLAFADAFAVWGKNKGSSSQTTFINGSGSTALSTTYTPTNTLTMAATLPSANAKGQSYTSPSVTAYDDLSAPHQVALKWLQSSSDPLSWSVSAYDADGNALVAANAFQVTFNSDGTLASATNTLTGKTIAASASGGLSLPITLNDAEGSGQSVSVAIGTVGTASGVAMAGNSYQTSSTSEAVSLQNVNSSITTLTMPSATLGTLGGTGQTYVTAPFDPAQSTNDANNISLGRTYLSVKWAQDPSSPDSWNAYIIDPYGSNVSSTLISVGFDDSGNLLQVNGQYSHDIPTLKATVNGVQYAVSIQPPQLSTSSQPAQTVLTTDSTVKSTVNGVSVDQIVSDYEKQQFETNDDNTDNGVGNALYFTRKMASVTSINQLMSDSTLLKVVETVSGYDPSTFGALDYNQQLRMLTSKVDFTKLKTPAQIQKYAEQYLTMLQINPQPVDTPSNMLDLFGGDTSKQGILALFDDNSSSSSATVYSALF